MTVQPDFWIKGRLPPAPEFAVHCLIADTLRRSLSPGWIWFHVPNGEKRPARIDKRGRRISKEGGRLKRMGVLPGVSDFLLIAPPSARLYALELKRRGETPSEDQRLFLRAVRAAGGAAEWVDSFDGAIAVLKSWNAVRIAA
jgi:hypothetical protein